MEKRYLINGKVMQGGEMPNDSAILYDKHIWQQSLTELACDSSELDKIKKQVSSIKLRWDEYIDITSITTVKDGKVYFKEVESESQEDLIKEINQILRDNMVFFTEKLLTIQEQFTITRK